MFIIPINENTANQLPEIRASRASSFYALVRGVPATCDHVEVHFAKPRDGVVNAVVCRRIPGGDWKCYASGFYFPDMGDAIYHVTAKDAEGGSAYLGSGTLRVMPSVLNIDVPDVPIIPDDAYAFNPRTGLWHKLIAETNDEGQIIIGVEQEGITK